MTALVVGALVYPLDAAGTRLRQDAVRVLATFVDRFGHQWVILEGMEQRYLAERVERAGCADPVYHEDDGYPN